MTMLQRLSSAYRDFSVEAFGPVSEVSEYCPHCEQQTLWAVRILNGYIRCQQCGRNPVEEGQPAASDEPTATPA